ncbi:MAG: aminoglycoside phosphotransferase family protein [Clostridia bacterium]|nr:aminoglycoside phosphotransferase family protein [Clostridia bacterium]
MKVERIKAISLDKKTAQKYAEEIAFQQIGQPIKKVKYLGGGSFGRAYKVTFEDNKKIVVKFLRARDMLEKEIFDLDLLAANCSVKIPRVLFSRKADDEIPVDCYGMELIEGSNAVFSIALLLRSKRKRKQFADEVTTALHNIHCCKNEKFGDTISPTYSRWLNFYRPYAEQILIKAEEMFSKGELPKKVIQTMRAAWEKFDIIFSEEVAEACLIHGDLNIANIMIDKNHKLSGFIDPLNSMYADREYDLFQFDNLSGKWFYLRETYVNKYGASEFCDAKCAFYGLYHEVYSYIKSGMLVNFIMNPLVKNMKKRLAEL